MQDNIVLQNQVNDLSKYREMHELESVSQEQELEKLKTLQEFVNACELNTKMQKEQNESLQRELEEEKNKYQIMMSNFEKQMEILKQNFNMYQKLRSDKALKSWKHFLYNINRFLGYVPDQNDELDQLVGNYFSNLSEMDKRYVILLQRQQKGYYLFGERLIEIFMDSSQTLAVSTEGKIYKLTEFLAQTGQEQLDLLEKKLNIQIQLESPTLSNASISQD